MTKDEKYISRCLQLARNGLCTTAPNPMVGAVIVRKDTIIGEGYHIRCGESHAEVNAIRSVKDESLLKESTLYVSLEPCSHYGKTPPCADLIIEKGIPKVVVGCMFQVPWTQIGSTAADWPEQGMQQLHALGFKTAAMALTDLSVSIDDAALAAEPKLAIVLGTEGDGLAHTTIAACDYTVRIPMSHGVDSLNVAAASAVAFWQLGKQ